jgi:hypothetical protein
VEFGCADMGGEAIRAVLVGEMDGEREGGVRCRRRGVIGEAREKACSAEGIGG